MAAEPFLLSAAWVFPVEGLPIVRGAVAVAGERIVAVGPAAELRRRFAGAREEALGNVALLPGLVNAHCHLELTYMRGRLGPPAHFTAWVADLMRGYPPEDQRAGVISAAAREGLEESLRAGVTTVGDITRQTTIARAALRSGPVRITSFGEVVGLGTMRAAVRRWLDAACDRSQESPTLRVGISPHAPYTVEGPALRMVAERAGAERLPVCMHLAELAEEREFLATCGGPLGRQWDLMLKMGILDEAIPTFAGGPIRWARAWGLLGEAAEGPGKVKAPDFHPGLVLAHVNYCDDAEMDILAGSGASVAYCPRTRAFFGHDRTTPHRFREMLSRGINVCLGTDSLASNPDLSLLREAQFVQSRHPDLPVATLLEMVTLRGARALGVAQQVGSLVPGKAADIIALELPPESADYDGDEVLGGLISQARAPEAVWIAGQRVV